MYLSVAELVEAHRLHLQLQESSCLEAYPVMQMRL